MDYLAPLRSELKQKIILSLLGGDKKLSELKSEVEYRETTILHVLKEFENLSLTAKSGGTYSLTSLGIIVAQICKDFNAASVVLEKFKDFWLPHDIKPIPPQLMTKIGALQDSTLIRTDRTELGKVYESFLQILMTSTKVTGVSPIFHPDYVPVIEHLLSQGNMVELILTNAVLKKTMSSAHPDQVMSSLKNGNLKIYLNEDLKVALTVTDKNFSLGLFLEGGGYDDKMDLISLSPQAIQWGEELFAHMLKTSRRIEPESLV